MKELRYIFPGCFCPPTYGHFNIVKRAAEVLPEVTIVCSVNPGKKGMIFSPEESKMLWNAYQLPENVNVVTFSEMLTLPQEGFESVIIRGIRNYEDLRDEERVMSINKERFGIDKYFYLICDNGLRGVSSTKVRKAAAELDFEKLAESVAPLVVSSLLEKILGIHLLFMVVGPCGSGKSTFIKKLESLNEDNVHINTDEYAKTLRPLLVEHFGEQDLIKQAIENKQEYSAVIKDGWFDLLKKSLLEVKKGSNVFLEIPYGLQPDKKLYNFVGGKIVYIGCKDKDEALRRNWERGTPKLEAFIKEIPDWHESLAIMAEDRLQLTGIHTVYHDFSSLDSIAKKFNKSISQGGVQWETFSWGLY